MRPEKQLHLKLERSKLCLRESFQKAVSLVVMLAMMNLMMACNVSKSPTGDLALHDEDPGKYELLSDSKGLSSEEPAAGQPALKIFELPMGILLYVINFELTENGYVVTYSYDVGGTTLIRRAVIAYDFSNMNSYDMLGNRLYHYSVDLAVDKNSTIFTFETSQDTLFMTYFINEVRQKYEFNGDIVDLVYESQEQLERSGWLFQNYTEENKSTLSPEDLALYEKIASLNELLSAPNSFADNMDAEVTGYLMADEQFLTWLASKNQNPPVTERDLCGVVDDIAAIVSLTCYLPLPWSAVTCIPAMGVSIACAAANLLAPLAD